MNKAIAIGLAVVTTAVVLTAVHVHATSTWPQSVPQRRTILRSRRPLPIPSFVLPEIVLNPAPARSHSGIVVTDDRIMIESYDTWIDFASKAVAQALVDGARGADGVLIHVMRRALPHHAWPPSPTNAIARQWPDMVAVVAQKLRLDPEPQPEHTSRRLHLI